MAINSEARIDSYAFLGIKNFIIRDKITHAVECTLPHMVNITIDDTTATDFLRGGYGNPKLLTLYGDRDCKLTGQTATQTMELLKVMSNATSEVKTKHLPIEETLVVDSGKFTLSQTPSTGIAPTIYKVDATTGKILKPALTVGEPSTNEGEYSISTNEVTCHSSVTKIKAIYDYDVEVETIEMASSTPKNYEAYGLMVAKEISTGNLYKAWIECPNISITLSNKIAAKNDTGAPDAIDIDIDLLIGSDGYPYALDFQKEA